VHVVVVDVVAVGLMNRCTKLVHLSPRCWCCCAGASVVPVRCLSCCMTRLSCLPRCCCCCCAARCHAAVQGAATPPPPPPVAGGARDHKPVMARGVGSDRERNVLGNSVSRDL
jgi:hypothetical protein